MGEHVLNDAALYFDGFDFTGKSNAVALEYGVELQDITTFADSSRRRLAGLKTVRVSHAGNWEGGDGNIDDALFARIGIADKPLSIVPAGATEGNRAFSFLSALGEYTPAGAIGDVFAFQVTGEASGADLVAGTLMHNAARTATGNGTARQLGAVSATQKLYATLHVLAASGSSPTLDVTVERDDAEGFLSALTPITFAQATAIGSEWATPIAGAITDDWWRIAWTIGGVSPSFTFIVVVSIQ